MESAGEHDDVRASGECFCDFNGILIGLSAAVCKVCFFVVAFDRCDTGKLFCQGNVTFVGDNIEHAVEIFVRLRLDSLYNLRLGESDI